MNTGGWKRTIGWFLAGVWILAGTSAPMRELARMPSTMRITIGYGAQLRLAPPFEAQASGAVEVVSVPPEVERLGTRSVSITACGEGEGTVTLRFLGILPVKTVRVSVGAEKTLVPGGNLVGVALRTRGALLVGTSDVGGVASPARQAGLRSGDTILSVDGVQVGNAQELSSLVDRSRGKHVMLTVERAGQRFEATVAPLADPRDGIYRLGAWVRDTTAGVGTLSFADPETNGFGALGHAVADVDAGTIMPIAEGYLYRCEAVEIRKGQPGSPGELVGSFFSGDARIGTVTENTPYGIYGQLTSTISDHAVPVCTRSEARLGPAQLLCELDNDGVHAYDCEIIRLNPQDNPSQRGLVIRVTDSELLARTGGIIQGMSGSPILQNGRILGAVTHVFVNDPTQGYGIYIEWMLDALEQAQDAAA